MNFEKTIAKGLLQLKQEGFTWKSFVRVNAKVLLFRSGVLAFFVVWAFLSDFHPFISAVAGMIFGSILRDIRIYHALRRTFPFTVRVTDWPLVEKIAHENA